MRKRIVIAAIALLALGISAFILSQPRKGSVEWHKREYREARMEFSGHRLSDRVRRVYDGVMGRDTSNRVRDTELELKAALHEGALVEMGFLGRRAVPVGQERAASAVFSLNLSKEAIEGDASGRATVREGAWTVVITAPSNDLPKWEEFVRTMKLGVED